jgi:hypothetical protein
MKVKTEFLNCLNKGDNIHVFPSESPADKIKTVYRLREIESVLVCLATELSDQGEKLLAQSVELEYRNTFSVVIISQIHSIITFQA